MIITSVLCFFFLIKLRLRGRLNGFEYFNKRYGQDGLRYFRNFFNNSLKLEKQKHDLDFLTKCKIYNVFPKFLRFKLYKRSLHGSTFYKSWQAKLLINEIKFKKKTISQTEKTVIHNTTTIQEQFSTIDIYLCKYWTRQEINKRNETTIRTHKRKLANLGIHNELAPCDPSEVISNYSSLELSPRLRTLLAFGLDFCLPVYRLNFYQFFLPLETIAYKLKKKFSSQQNFSEFLQQFQTTAFKFFYSFNPHKIFSAIIKKGDIQLLKNLASNEDVIVVRPDKGRGVVILNRSDYTQSMEKTISDPSKFKPIEEPMEKFTLRVEDKINRFLLKLKNLKKIPSEVYDKLRSTGSSPGILYGLPKIHKPDFSSKFQFRPIFAAYKTPSYNLAKYLVPILNPLTTNQYTVENSYKFAEEIQDQDGASGLVMASFDVENLFTNIPLQETIQIIIKQLFTCPTDNVMGLTRDDFIQLLDLSVSNSFFLFNNKLVSQVDGLGMGLPLGPTFANIFLSFHEKSWLEHCPSDFKPVYFRRYVDDCFILFSNRAQIPEFLNYLNSKHPNIKFTCELEQNSKISFLDCSVTKVNNKFETSTFRKSTFTGLGTSFFSFTPFSFKINGIKTLINRGYKVTSNCISRNSEFNFLRQYFFNNGFPKSLINSQIDKFLKNTNNATSNESSDETLYASFPFYFSLF